jgi:hypothetical protein
MHFDPGLRQCPALQVWSNALGQEHFSSPGALLRPWIAGHRFSPETLGTGVIEARSLLKRYLEQGTISAPMSAWAGALFQPPSKDSKTTSAHSMTLLHAAYIFFLP